jgi:hypothetical protein
MRYKTGSIGEFMNWTKQLVAGLTASSATPKRWFDSDETAARSVAHLTKVGDGAISGQKTK